MSCLLHAVFGGQRPPEPPPTGVAGRPVTIVTRQGLSAAVSDLAEAAAPSGMAGMLAHQRVVQCYFRHGTVVPLRYGACVAGCGAVTELLRGRRAQWQELLRKLDGFAEMGIRLLLGDPVSPPTAGTGTVAPTGDLPGACYLLGRKLHYRDADRTAERECEMAEALCGSLAGLFRIRKLEQSSPRGLLSLYFLVPRAAVESFRQKSREALRGQPAKLLVSGPWPPYNFVEDDDGGVFCLA